MNPLIPKHSTKTMNIIETAKTLGKFHYSDIAELTEIGKHTVSATISRLKKDNLLEALGDGHFRWIGRDTPILSSLQSEIDAMPDFCSSSPSNRPPIDSLTSALEWQASYISSLEAENQSLYEALCKYGNLAASTRRRYEDRLAAIIETNHKSRKNRE